MILIVLVALVFYGLLPLSGAWRARRSWSRFRKSLFDASRSPELDFPFLQPDGPLPSGPFRLTGTLEAFEGKDRLWIGNGRVSIAVSLRNVPVYFLDEHPDPFSVEIDPPRKAEAASLGALPEGTQFLVFGSLVRGKANQPRFGTTPEQPLLVLAFEGDRQTVVPRAVYAGRPPVDLWNSWTPISLGFGFLTLLILAYGDLRAGIDRTAGLVGLALALMPSTFFLPPGILFFYSFWRLWVRARDHRARGELASMEPTTPPEVLGHHRERAAFHELLAYSALVFGLAANGILLVVIIQTWIL